jgi:hypothetical protein
MRWLEDEGLTRLDGRRSLVTESGDSLTSLLGGGLLRVGSDCSVVSIVVGRAIAGGMLTLLRGLLAETLASKIRHVDCVGVWLSVWVEVGLVVGLGAAVV